MSLDGIPITAIVEGLDGDAYVVTIDERKYREHLLSMPLSAEPPDYCRPLAFGPWATETEAFRPCVVWPKFREVQE